MQHDQQIELLRTVEVTCERAALISESERRGITTPMLAVRALTGLLVEIARKLGPTDRILLSESLRSTADVIERG